MPLLTDRIQWIDVAKGLTIVLIVFAHTLGKHYMRLEWDIDMPIRGGWLEVNRLFGPMRMPLFLLLSGLVASRSLERGGGRSLVRRVVNPYVLYVLWLAFSAALFSVFDPAGQIDGLELTAAGLLRNLVLPETTLWYMMALAVFYLGATVLRPLSPTIAVGGSLMLSAAVFAGWLVLPEWTGTADDMLRYFPFFLIGALLPGFPLRIAELRRRRLVVAVLVTYLGVAVVFARVEQVDPFSPIAGIVGATAGIMVAVRMSDLGGLATALAWLGRRTLPVFVLHVPFLAIVHWMAVGPGEGLWAQLLSSDAAAALYPPIGTAITVGVCLGVAAGVGRAGMGWLFALSFGRQNPSPRLGGRPRAEQGHPDRPFLAGRTDE